MGLLTRLRRALAAERRDAGAAGASVGIGSGNFGGMAGGGAVSPYLAENLSCVCACISATASAISSLPARVYRTTEGGRVELHDHPIARLIRRGPCERLTWPEWLEMTVASALGWGNALSVIEHDGAGRITGLRPVPWPCVLVSLLPDGTLAYDVMAFVAPWGGTGAPRRYLAGEVLHIMDRTDDGYVGRSRLSRAPEMFAAALGIQTYSAAIWRNSATPAGVVTHAARLSPESKNYLREQFSQHYEGASNARRTILLDEGMTWAQQGLSPEDSEVLESRKFSVIEICRVYQTPPPIVQDYSNNTFTNAAQASLWFAQITLTPWARKIEAAFTKYIFTDDDVHLEIDLAGLMRGSFEARWAAWGPAIAAGILTANEVREMEGFNPRPEQGELVPGAGTP